MRFCGYIRVAWYQTCAYLRHSRVPYLLLVPKRYHESYMNLLHLDSSIQGISSVSRSLSDAERTEIQLLPLVA
jgi:hypothetical protein